MEARCTCKQGKGERVFLFRRSSRWDCCDEFQAVGMYKQRYRKVEFSR